MEISEKSPKLRCEGGLLMYLCEKAGKTLKETHWREKEFKELSVKSETGSF